MGGENQQDIDQLDESLSSGEAGLTKDQTSNLHRDVYRVPSNGKGNGLSTDNGSNFDEEKEQRNDQNNLLAYWQDTKRPTLLQLAIKRADQKAKDTWGKIKADPAKGIDNVNEFLTSVDAAIRQRKRQVDLDPQEAETARGAAKKIFPEVGQAQDLKTLEILLEAKGASLPDELLKVLNIHEQMKKASGGTANPAAIKNAIALELRRQAGAELIADRERIGEEFDATQWRLILGPLSLSNEELANLKEALTGKKEAVEPKEEAIAKSAEREGTGKTQEGGSRTAETKKEKQRKIPVLLKKMAKRKMMMMRINQNHPLHSFLY